MKNSSYFSHLSLTLATLGLLSVCESSAAAEEPEADSPTLEERLRAGTQIPFWCGYTIWQRTYSPWGTPTGGEYVDKSGTGTLDVKLVGNSLYLTNPKVSDVQGAGWWAPGEWTFRLDSSGSASYDGFWKYSVSLQSAGLSLSYSYSSRASSERSTCVGVL